MIVNRYVWTKMGSVGVVGENVLKEPSAEDVSAEVMPNTEERILRV